jgi:integrase/recombinase XerC
MSHTIALSSSGDALRSFLDALSSRNLSPATLRAYRIDILQFLIFLKETNVAVRGPADVDRADVAAYLAYLGRLSLSGVSRARKLAALRSFFAFLVAEGCVPKSPAAGVVAPKKERRERTYLRPSEYRALLSVAGSNPRDYAILQTFLQTGLRVSELCSLELRDVDLIGRSLTVRGGKGLADRTIELEYKASQAIKNHLSLRPPSKYQEVFLNQYGEPIGERGVRKLLVTYARLAGLSRSVTCHSLRHTFATYKAERGVSPFMLQRWLGHRNLTTTQIYVHMGRENALRVMENTSL